MPLLGSLCVQNAFGPSQTALEEITVLPHTHLLAASSPRTSSPISAFGLEYHSAPETNFWLSPWVPWAIEIAVKGSTSKKTLKNTAVQDNTLHTHRITAYKCCSVNWSNNKTTMIYGRLPYGIKIVASRCVSQVQNMLKCVCSMI